MNKKALYLGLIYATLVILFKLFIVLGGYSLSKFGYYYSNIVSVFLILPFYYLVIKLVRDRDYNGVIGGRESVRIALTLFAVAVVIISVYNYFEFKYNGQQLAESYYRSDEFLKFLETQKNIKTTDYPKIINEQIIQAQSSAFKATTGKILSYLIIGVSGAVIMAASLKRSSPKTN